MDNSTSDERHEPPERVDIARASRLVSTAPRRLDSLRWVRSERRYPSSHEVEIQVYATGLGFRDVLLALGMYPGEPQPLGVECAGVVVTVGTEVTGCREGDFVFGVASGCFASHVMTEEDFVVPVPAQMSLAAAAAMPSSFLTAHYGLEVLGQLRSGQRVLIHAGAGGVGQLALQIATAAGAEIFATAGSDVKRRWLREHGAHHVFDSRRVDFVADILALTEGRGLDLVLNCLSGPFISASFAVLAEEGCFVEIGKRSILGPAEVAQLKPRGRYAVVDLGELGRIDPAAIRLLLATLIRRLDAGEVVPPTLEIFPVAHVVDAFRHMARAEHVGKIVVVDPVGTTRFKELETRPVSLPSDCHLQLRK